jgi:N-acetylneuraminic acid mutarotase
MERLYTRTNSFLIKSMKKIVLALFIGIVGTSFGQIQNTWTKMGDFAGLKRERAVAFSIGNYGYTGTGIDTAEIVHNDLWQYDASLDAWSQVASMPGSIRRNAVGFSINDKGYIGTGINTVAATDIGAVKLADLWEYDPTLNSWIQKANFPGFGGVGMYFTTAFSVGDKAYLVGGKLGPNNYSNQTWEYDSTNDLWTQKSNFPGGVRYQLSSFTLNGKGYAGLGTDQDLYRKDWWEYKPSLDQWIARADLPSSERANATTFSIGSRGFVCMGTNGGSLGDLWEFDEGTNSWNVRASYGGSARKGAIAMVVNNRAYVGTGKGVSGKKASMHEYNPYYTVGLNELDNAISIYPNPATDVINVSSSAPVDELTLTNMYGQVVLSEAYTKTLNVNGLSAGVYYLTGQTNGSTIGSQKIIIQ